MLNKILKGMLAVAVLMLVGLIPVLALADPTGAAVNPGSTVVNASGALSAHESLIYLLLAAGAALLYKLLAAKFPFIADLLKPADYQKLVEPLLHEAVHYGVSKVQGSSLLEVDVKNQAVAAAAQYALDHGGDALAKFGISEDALKQKLEAKLAQNGWTGSSGG